MYLFYLSLCYFVLDSNVRICITLKLLDKCRRNESFPNQVLSSLEMALSLSPQGFARSHIGERCLPLMPSERRLSPMLH